MTFLVLQFILVVIGIHSLVAVDVKTEVVLVIFLHVRQAPTFTAWGCYGGCGVPSSTPAGVHVCLVGLGNLFLTCA